MPSVTWPRSRCLVSTYSCLVSHALVCFKLSATWRKDWPANQSQPSLAITHLPANFPLTLPSGTFSYLPHFQNHKENTSKDSSQIFHKQFTRVKPTCLLPFEPYQNKSNLNLFWSCRFCFRIYLLLTFLLIIRLIAVSSSALLIPKLTKVSFWFLH